MDFYVRMKEIVRKFDQRYPFSGAILIQDDKAIFEQGFGYANRSEHIHNTLRTRFGMASGCKTFTSVAICQLVQKGSLSFDTYIQDCLDCSLQHFHPKITIDHLLTHTSGIPDYFDEEVMSDFEELWKAIPMYSVLSPKDFLPMFQNQHMKFEPGSRFAYSNAGFILLGLIVEQMTGMTFPQYVQENIFRICDMSDSGYFRMDRLPERTALGYIDCDEDHTWKTNIYSVPIVGGPDGGAFTTVFDLEKFWTALLSTELLDEEHTTKLFTPHVQSKDQLFYGYGVWVSMRNNDVFKYFMFGSDPGVRLYSAVYTKSKIHVHIMANIDQGVAPLVKEIDKLIVNNGIK